MSRGIEVFFLNASSSRFGAKNRWVIYGEFDSYEVYLETTKDSNVASVHAATFDGQDQALEFVMQMDQLCTNGTHWNVNNYLMHDA